MLLQHHPDLDHHVLEVHRVLLEPHSVRLPLARHLALHLGESPDERRENLVENSHPLGQRARLGVEASRQNLAARRQDLPDGFLVPLVRQVHRVESFQFWQAVPKAVKADEECLGLRTDYCLAGLVQAEVTRFLARSAKRKGCCQGVGDEVSSRPAPPAQLRAQVVRWVHWGLLARQEPEARSGSLALLG
jgi:hypothetical protein